jgi:hypothetical protein
MVTVSAKTNEEYFGRDSHYFTSSRPFKKIIFEEITLSPLRSVEHPHHRMITKRLHVSGLTPGLTPGLTADDLEKRISSFGTIRAVDGFCLPDGSGQPRKNGYIMITIETTPAKLAICM